jgi:hypothetical protein
MLWPGIENVPLQCEAGDKPSEPWHNPEKYIDGVTCQQ